MNLKHLTDKSLHTDTIRLVTREREVTSQILHYLKENDRRKLYSDHQCPSLFRYCVKILGYSESSAQRRIVAARLLSDLPQIESKLEEGTLSLTNISQANQFFRENEISSLDEKKEILGAIENLTKKQCEKKTL
jgi:Asp-tRNA(Asn)/Glu-tRNA(Gln) amidotransferase B subunit